MFRRVSGRIQLTGRVTDIKISRMLARVTLAIGESANHVHITADAVRELGLKREQIAIALINSTGVMICVPESIALTVTV